MPISEIASFLQQAQTIDYLELVKAFRHWVRSQLETNLIAVAWNYQENY